MSATIREVALISAFPLANEDVECRIRVELSTAHFRYFTVTLYHRQCDHALIATAPHLPNSWVSPEGIAWLADHGLDTIALAEAIESREWAKINLPNEKEME